MGGRGSWRGHVLPEARDPGAPPLIRLFGAPDLRLARQKRAAPTKRERLLAHLAVQEGAEAEAAVLIPLLFDDPHKAGHRGHLADALYHLGRDLEAAFGPGAGGAVTRSGSRVRLGSSVLDADAALFLRLCDDGTPEALRRARALYRRGRLLEGWGEEGLGLPWCEQARGRFAARHRDLLRALLAQARRNPRRRQETIGLLEDLAAAQPGSAPACRDLAEYLRRCGEYDAALRVLREFRRAYPDAEDEALAGAERRVVAACLEEPAVTPEGAAREAVAHVKGAALAEGADERLAAYALGGLLETAQAALAGFSSPHTAQTRAAQDRLRREAGTARAALGASAGSGTLARRGLALAEVLVELWAAQGDWEGARCHLERLVTLPPDLSATEARANVLNGLGVLAVQTQDFEGAFRLLGQALAVGEQLPEEAARERTGARVHNSLAFLHHYRPDPDLDRTEHHLRRSLALFGARERAGEPSRDVAWPLLGLGTLLVSRARQQEAEGCFEDCLAAGGHRRATAYAHQELARLCGERGDAGGAYGHLAAQLAIFRDLEDAGGLASALDAFAGWASSDGQWGRAARLAGAAEAWRGHAGIRRWPWQQPLAAVLLSRLGERLGPRRRDALLGELAAMPADLERAVREALGGGAGGRDGAGEAEGEEERERPGPARYEDLERDRAERGRRKK